MLKNNGRCFKFETVPAEGEVVQAAKILIEMKSPLNQSSNSAPQLSILISPPESLDFENKISKMDGFNWLLVEYIGDDTTLCPKYSIININRVVNRADVYIGKVVLIHSKYSSNPCRVQIIKMADDKRHLKMYKLYLERQDKQVRNILAVCMRTIKGIRQDPGTEFGIPIKTDESTPGPSTPKPASTAVPAIVADFDTDSESSDLESDSSSNLITPDDLQSINRPKKPPPLSDVNTNELPQKQRVSKGIPTRVAETDLLLTEMVKKETVDKSVQTDEWEPFPEEMLTRLEDSVTQLYRRYLVLEASVQNLNNQDRESQEQGALERAASAASNVLQEPVHVGETERFNYSDEGDAKVNGNCSDAGPMTVRKAAAHTTNPNPKENDDVEIGNGYAKIPIRVWRNIRWECYSNATRQMLNAIFPRKILATHSLTGKASPAFIDKPAKKQLDPKIVADIVDTVSERCQVTKTMVRSIITTKCTDEARLYQNRQAARRNLKVNRVTTRIAKDENASPATASSQDSSNETD